MNIANYKPLALKSEGVSGDVLAEGSLDVDGQTIPIVMKIYSTQRPVRTFKHGSRTITRTRNVSDESRFEIGNTMALTQMVLMNERHMTPHITFALGYGISESAYETDQSLVSGQYIVPKDCDGKLAQYPQCAFRSNYDDGSLSDTVRYLVVEKVTGDLEAWIKVLLEGMELGQLTVEEFDYSLATVLLMILYTLYVLDDYFDGFVHGDLGPRNILMLQPKFSSKFLRYQLTHEGVTYTFHTSQDVGVVPKLWDFDKCRINKVPREMFSYLSDAEMQRTSCPFNEDVSILFNKIRQLILPSGSRLLPTIDRIMSLAQTMNNREMSMVFLTDPFITKLFSTPVPEDQVEFTFSYP